MQKRVDSTIKRVYDQYHLDDFEYGKIGSDNLNPQREIIRDKVKLIEAAVQELTDELVRKKIRPPKKEDPLIRAPLGRESVLDTSKSILDVPKPLEALVGTLPGNLDDLDAPPIIDCENVFKKYDFGQEEIVEEPDDDGEPTFFIETGNTESDGQIIDDEDEEIKDKESEEAKECQMLELEWLKMVNKLLEIVQMLNSIVDKVISTIMMIVKTVCLAAGAWLNPPNIAQLIQMLVSIILSLISEIIGKLISAIFSSLDLECIAEQSFDLLNQTNDAMNTFKQTLGAVDPNALNLIGDTLESSYEELKDTFTNLLKNKKEAWAQAQKEIKETFSKENLSKLKDQLLDDALKTAKDTALSELQSNLKNSTNGYSDAIVAEAITIKNNAVSIAEDAKNKWDEMQKAFNTAKDKLLKLNSNKMVEEGTPSTGDETHDRIVNDPTINGGDLKS